jgi:hypothetical protein
VRVVIQLVRSSARSCCSSEREGEWQTVRTFDNAHAPEEHDEHRYVGSEKQAPVITHGPVNDARADWVAIPCARCASWRTLRRLASSAFGA